MPLLSPTFWIIAAAALALYTGIVVDKTLDFERWRVARTAQVLDDKLTDVNAREGAIATKLAEQRIEALKDALPLVMTVSGAGC